MPNHATARYRARDGTEHKVLVQRTPEGRWRVLDRRGDQTVVVETLTGHDDRLTQAEALARDYAAEQQAYHGGQRLENPLPKPGRDDGEEQPWAA
jgi:glucose dehydrogenase